MDAKKTVKQMFSGLGAPPSHESAVGNLQIPHAGARRVRTEPMVQLNLRVPASTKKRVRILAARDNLSLSEVVLKALDVYEERYGRAPKMLEGWMTAIWVGWLFWALALAASVAMNASAGYGLGRTAVEGDIFAGLSMAADGWKAIALIFVARLLRGGRWVPAAFSLLIWIACFLYAATSAISFAGLNRSGIIGGREAMHAAFDSAKSELAELKDRQQRLKSARAAIEIEATIQASLAEPVAGRGTVGSLSNDCSKDNARTRTACADIASMRIELAQATEKDRTERTIGGLEKEMQRLDSLGASTAGDPQERLISRLSFGKVAISDVGLGLVLLLVGMVELISAFGPLVIAEYAQLEHPNSNEPAKFNEAVDVTDLAIVAEDHLFEFLASCVRPARYGTLSFEALYDRYTHWCRQLTMPALEPKGFLQEFVRICGEELEGRVQKTDEGFSGIRLIDGEPLRLLPRS